MNAPGTHNPATGLALPPVRLTAPSELPGMVAAARLAARAWAATPLAERERVALAIARDVVEDRERGARILSDELGRSPGMNEVAELSNAVSYARSAIQAGRKALAAVRIRLSPLDYPGKKVVVEAVPRGVIGIIAPWNYPIGNVTKPLFPALLSGNGVVLKPSEHCPRSGAWLAELCNRHLPAGLLHVALGGGDVGASLIDAGVDGLTFTGSVLTGRKVAAAAAERLIPCSVELGGKDAAVVLADTDLDRTALGIAQWSLFNTGQDCSSIERLVVEQAVADALVERLKRVFERLRVTDGTAEAELGPLQNEAQLAIVEDHVADALARGATLVCGGRRTGPGLGYLPTLLDRCTPDMRVVREETFGPVLAVLRVADAEEAIRVANDCDYGLNGSVWTRDIARGEALARRLEVGVALVNNHSITGTLAETPWSGTRHTGPGVAASQWSYGAFVRRRTVLVDRSKDPDPFWFPNDDSLGQFRRALAERNLGGGLGTLLKLGGLVGKRVKAVRGLLA